MSWDPEAWTRNLIADMREHGGRPASGPMAGKPLMILTTKGAKSGAERTAIVTYHRDGDAWVIAASKSGAPDNPAWYYNLRANPDVSLNGIPMRATVVTNRDELERLWKLASNVFAPFAAYRVRAAAAG